MRSSVLPVRAATPVLRPLRGEDAAARPRQTVVPLARVVRAATAAGDSGAAAPGSDTGAAAPGSDTGAAAPGGEAGGSLQALLRQTEQALRASRLFDPVTGLLHRELFFDRLAQAAAGVQRGGASFAVLVIGVAPDEDDARMAAVGRRLLSLGRHSDSFTRLDGHCHAGLLLGNHSIGGAIAMAQKIVDDLATLLAAPAGATRAGVAMCPQHGNDAHTLLLNAHASMRQARCAPGVAVTAQRPG